MDKCPHCDPKSFALAHPLYETDVKRVYSRDAGYLFFTIGDGKWFVDKILAAPRFFRDRFAQALGVPERGDWKAMQQNPYFMKQVGDDITSVLDKWEAYFQ